MSRYESRTAFEGAIARLHFIDLLDRLGPSPKGTVVVVLPPTTEAETWLGPALMHLRELREGKDLEGVVVEDIPEFDDHGAKPTAFDVALLTNAGLHSGHTGARCMLYLTDDGHADIQHPSIRMADDILYLDLRPALIAEAAARMGRVVNLAEVGFLARMPSQHRKLALAAARPIRESYDLHLLVLEREEALKLVEDTKKPKNPTRQVPDVIPLDDLHGYGEAKLWGLDLARDIADWQRGDIRWSDVDNGVLLSGPPGCGKTTFAAALAKTLGAHFVAGSYSAWLGTGDGHQGDLIKSMRAAFREARENTPCVLLIDEIDNFIARGSVGHGKTDEWMRGVVNALLECLDGAVEREGVIVVGATNDASGIDGALLRPGRLDRHIAIPLPDEEARTAILQQHLGVDLDLRLLRRKTVGMSGADLERLARDARRLARREGVEVRHSHVARALPRREARADEEIRYIAVHEIGHALVGAVLGAEIEEVFVCRDRDPEAKAEVAGAAIVHMRSGRRDFQWHADRAAHLLGGIAAEEAVYGSHGDGVVLDLVEASSLLTYAISTLGMGDTLVSDGHRDPQSLATARSYDPVLRRRVEDALQEQLERARDIIAAHRQAFHELVEVLAKRCRMQGLEVQAIINNHVNAAPQLSQLSLAI